MRDPIAGEKTVRTMFDQFSRDEVAQYAGLLAKFLDELKGGTRLQKAHQREQFLGAKQDRTPLA